MSTQMPTKMSMQTPSQALKNNPEPCLGYWYAGYKSTRYTATLRVSSQGQLDVIDTDTLATLHTASIDSVDVSSRLGNTTRYVHFDEHKTFETHDNDGIDAILNTSKPSAFRNGIHFIERSWLAVLCSTIIVIALGYWSATDGVPLAAKKIAEVIPSAILVKADEQTVEFLDSEWMEESKLTAERQQSLLEHFQPLLDQYPEENIRVLFRYSEPMGANAFALPNGTIIFTDDIIELAQHDDELLSIMAHEVGHVVNNHSMRNVIQGSLTTFLVVLITGDASAVADVFIGLPVLLAQLGYSRDFEREADDFSLKYMQTNNINSSHFSRIMQRIEQSQCPAIEANNEGETDHATATTKETSKETPKETEEEMAERCRQHNSWQRYLSTHPSTEERIEKFEHAH